MRRAGMVTLGVCCVWLGIAAPQCEGQPAEAERMLSPAKQAILEKMQRKRELRQQRQDDHQLQGESSHPLSTYADTAVARNPFQHKEEEHKRTVDAAAGADTHSHVRGSGEMHPPAPMITSPPSFPPVAIKFSREAQLVTHYDSHLKYTSTVDEPNMIVDMAQRLGVGPRQLRMDFSRVLDLGSGDGRLTRHMAQFQGVEQVTGVDYSFARHLLSQREGNRTLQKKYGDKIRWVYADVNLYVQELVRRRATVDLVTMFEVLEHLEDPDGLAHSIRTNLLSAGGMLLGSVPLNMPYVAHLQVWPDIDAVVSVFQPTAWYEERGAVFFRCDRMHASPR